MLQAETEVQNPHRIRVPDLKTVRGEHRYDEAKVTVRRALRDDPLGWMHSRGQINEAQYQAGREYQATREAEGIGTGRSPSELREHVDGGHVASDGITDTKLRAAKRVAAWRSMLGEDGYQLAEAVLVENRQVKQCALSIYGSASPANRKYAGRRFRECLDALAKNMGFG